ncbi:WGR domain-containing protein [Henriciella mobilis]|uniref:WGR domain-containing protein n=1 Tax=Henriciella mobilis TaxID=2305467 RepID=A0A399RJN2_9PROT|nr:WGR domain-containing protein [Henriciella mobilis]RIJ30207.1 WGR domain-containing protein [Henriciella mobilis]
MIKLYKREPDGAISAYFEVWAEPENRRLIEHWGRLGDKGQTRAHRVKFLRSLERQFDDRLTAPREAGYEELDTSEQSVLVVEYVVDGFGTEDDLEKRQALEDFLNETLGWKGLGHCDGGSIGSDTMEAACFVVDFDLAKAVVIEALEGTAFVDYSRIYKEE